MRVAVTGASGHVGANLVRALVARGDEVRVLLRSDDRAVCGLDVERMPGDLLDPVSLAPLVAGAEVVFHLAARISIHGDRDGELERVNVVGTRHLAAASVAARVRRLVHFSSIHALESPPGDGAMDEDSPAVAEAGAPAYDRSKGLGERAALAAAARGLEVVILQPTAIVGPFDFKPSYTGQLIVSLMRRRLPALVAGGFDWVDVRDVAATAIAAAERGRPGERYLVSGRWLAIAELAGEVERATGVSRPPFVAPLWAARLGVPFATLAARLRGSAPLYTRESLRALRRSRRVRGDKAAAELGHRARPFAETIRDTVGWWRDNDSLIES